MLTARCRTLAAACLVLATLAGGTRAQPAPAGNKDTVFRSGAREVLLDLVVRDQRGRAVRDLRPDEVKIFEDGAAQEITSFRLIDGTRADSTAGPVESTAPNAAAAAPADTAAKPPAGGPDPLRLNHLVSIVFQGLTPDSRKFVYDGALDFLEKNLSSHVFVGVFAIDTHLQILEPFTNDHERLREAVRKAAEGSTASFSGTTMTVAGNPLAQVEFTVPGAGTGSSPQSQGGSVGPGARPQTADIYGDILARIQSNTAIAMEFFDRVDRADKAVLALQGLVDAQKGLSGRKTILLFSPGFQMPADSQWRFDQLVSEANRANVTFYSIDAAGLRTLSPLLSQTSLLTAGGLPPGLIPTNSSGRLTPRDFRQYETQLESVHGSPQGILQELAVETGGRLIADTNNFSKPLDRVVEDVLTYYEVAYRPPAPRYDGAFRPLRVEITRPKVEVQTRNGYFDMPEDAEFHVAPHELPLLAALGSNRPPKDLPFRSSVVRFPGASQGSMVAEFALNNLELVKSSDGKSFEGRLSVLAQLKNAEGRIVKKASEDLPLLVPKEKLDALRHGVFTLNRTWELEPGRYTLETAMRDEVSGRIGVGRSVAMIQRAGDGPALSNVSLIRRVDAGARQPDEDLEQHPGDPFLCSAGKVTPTLADVVDPQTAGNISHYFVIYPAAASDEKPRLFLQYLRDDQVVAQTSPELPAQQADGSIPYIATAPASSFPPGHYLMNVVVKQGGRAAVERAFFQVGP